MQFEREAMIQEQSNTGGVNLTKYIEGYFRDPLQPNATADYPQTWKAHKTPWEGRDYWVGLLDLVEAHIRNYANNMLTGTVYGYNFMSYPNPAHCRICKGVAGFNEYWVYDGNVRYIWPEGTKHYYVVHNCLPSKQFYNFIAERASQINSFRQVAQPVAVTPPLAPLNANV